MEMHLCMHISDTGPLAHPHHTDRGSLPCTPPPPPAPQLRHRLNCRGGWGRRRRRGSSPGAGKQGKGRGAAPCHRARDRARSATAGEPAPARPPLWPPAPIMGIHHRHPTLTPPLPPPTAASVHPPRARIGTHAAAPRPGCAPTLSGRSHTTRSPLTATATSRHSVQRWPRRVTSVGGGRRCLTVG